MEEKRNKYYILPLDNYNQPNGYVDTIWLTEKEYEIYKKKGGYIYKDYATAIQRASD